MKALEIWYQGQKLATAGLLDGIVDARFLIRNQADPMWLEVRGRDASTGGHVEWMHRCIRIGDEFVLRVVDIDPPMT